MEKNSADGKTMKATMWYLICDFITRGISFITMPIFTRLLSTEEIGKFSVLTSWISILTVVVTLNLIQSVFLAKFDYKDDYDGFVSTVAVLGFLSALVCYIIIFPFRTIVSNFLGIDEYALNVLGVHLMFCQMSGILLAKYRAKFEYKKSVFLTIGTTVIVTSSAILCTILFDDSLKGRVYGTYLPTILLNVMLFVFVLYRKKSFKKEYCKYALVIGAPLIIHNLAGNLMHSSDRVMIGKLCSSEDAGLYGVAYSCAMFANILRNSMNSAWNPWVFEKLNKNENEKIKKASYIYLLFFFIVCVGIIMLAPEILYIIGGENYLSAKYVVPPVVSAYMFSMVYSLYAGIEQYYKKQKYFALFATICALVNIGLNFLFIPIYGYLAAAYTTMAGTALECLLHYINVRRMGMANIYNGKFNIFILILINVVSFASIYAYQNYVLRFLLVLFVLIVCVIFGIKYKKMIKNFVFSMIKRR